MRCFTVLGPSQSGKTTLVRQLAALDGGTARSEAAGHVTASTFDFMGERWCALDHAGGPDFVPMAAGPLMAADAAVLCVPADPAAAMLSAPYLRLLEASGTPTLVFINRIDAPAGRVRDIVAALQAYTGTALVLRQIPIREGSTVVGAVDLISERAWRYREGQPSTLVAMPDTERDRETEARSELLEHMSDFDDGLLEQLIEDRIPAAGTLYAIAARELAQSVVTPVFLGSALHMNGVHRLMKALRHEAPRPGILRERLAGPGGEAPAAVAFHAQMRRHLGKAVFLRALDDGLAGGGRLAAGGVGGLAAVGGGSAGPLAAGEVAVAVKSDQLVAGRALTAEAMLPAPAWAVGRPPMLIRLLAPESDRDDARLAAALARLQEIEPSMTVTADEETGTPALAVQGPMHLRQVLASLADDFGLTVTARPRSGVWRETIANQVEVRYRHKKQTGGAGQFAEVALTVAPQARGAGFAFGETVKGGTVPRNYFPSVEAGAQDALARGPLGFPVVDLSVTLSDGKFHAVDSSDHAFRTAGRMGVREALEKAGPVLLQGIERVSIHVPSATSGALVSLISTLKGQVLGFDRDPGCRGWDLFRALLPGAATDELLQALAGATQGTAWVETEFDHFEEVYGREAETVSRARLEALAGG
ncbi:MAG: elongation factor G [Rhodobacteraceae bacterium]|jgi:elongation factor G|nr:elongation factor G [Paracoccaceae bacterium]